MSTLRRKSCSNTSESVNKSYSFVGDHKLCTCNSSSQECLRDTKWWLNHEDLGKGYLYDQINVMGLDITPLSPRYIDENAKVSGENHLIEEYCTIFSKNPAALCSDSPSKKYCSHAKNDQDSWLQELEDSNAHFMHADCELTKKHCSDLDSQWTELTEIEPWWHSADKDDSASFISRRSSAHFRNCDLRSQKGSESNNVVKCFEQVKEQMAEKKEKVSYAADCSRGNNVKGSYVADSKQRNFVPVNMDISLDKPGLIGLFQGSDGTISHFNSNVNSRAAKVDSSVTPEQAYVDLNKTQLLEALCHSQTRAREAEKLAQQACEEKDHIIELFFRQASYLFAYKQWLRILQVETLCLEHGSKSHPPSARKTVPRKDRRTFTRKKSGKCRCFICKYAFAFAIGLTLAGAGLFVGWTIGCLFPAL